MKKEIIIRVFYVKNIKKVEGGEDFLGGLIVKTLPFHCLWCHAVQQKTGGLGWRGRDTTVMCRGIQQKRDFIFDDVG